MSGSVPIQIRGTPSNGPPVGLVERQLAIEMNNGNLWCGVPVSIDSTGRIQLNPRRIPAGGSQWQVLTKGTGAAFNWAIAGDRGDENTAVGENSLAAFLGSDYYNTAIGAYALQAATVGEANTAVGRFALGNLTGVSGNSNTAIGALAGFRFGSGTGVALTNANNSVYLGSNARAASDGVTNEIVIGADTVGHGDNTVSLPSTATHLWCGGRDLLAVNQPPPYGMAQATVTNLPNDGSVHDIVNCLLDAGLWLVVVRVWMDTPTTTPWFQYGAGLNMAPGQTAIADGYYWATTVGNTFNVSYSNVNIFRIAAPATIYGCTFAINSTNAGVYRTTVTLEPFLMST